MKILAISDRVVEQIYSPAIGEHFGDVDLVLGCGDLPPNYLEFIISMLDVPLFYVFGNHDQGIYTAAGGFQSAPAGGVNVDGRVVQSKGLLIGGLEGSRQCSRSGTHQYSEWEMGLKALRMAPTLWLNRLIYGRFLDILITHAPPYRIHDAPDRCHTGFKTFLRIMDRCRPRYLVHGHLHVSDSRTPVRTPYHHTLVVNAYRYQVIHWNDAQEIVLPLQDGRERS